MRESREADDAPAGAYGCRPVRAMDHVARQHKAGDRGNPGHAAGNTAAAGRGSFPLFGGLWRLRRP